MKRNKITITREDFTETLLRVLSHPFDEEEEKKLTEEQKVQMQMGIFFNGMVIASKLERELFGEE